MTAVFPVRAQLEREIRAWTHAWQGPVFNGVVMPLLLLGSLGIGLGGLVDQHSGGVDGLEYLVYATPGVLAGTAVRTAAGSAMWPVLSGMKWTGTYHSAVSTPAGPTNVYAGLLAWIALRQVANAAVFLGLAALCHAVPSVWGALAIPAAVLGALAVAAPVAAFAADQETDQPFELVERLVVVPLFLFSGTFFPATMLPDVLRPLIQAAPLWHAVELCRDATTGRLAAGSSLGHLLVLLAWIGVGSWWGSRTFRRRLTS